MLLSPLPTEVLPGAKRLSSMFVFPVEVFVWGGGAVLIRYAVRKWNMGWLHLLFMALALSIAEEFLIQQTSFALIFGVMIGSMMAGFVGFIGAAPMDLYFKIVVNILAVFLMIRLGLRMKKQPSILQQFD